jgi:hypothetical protein
VSVDISQLIMVCLLVRHGNWFAILKDIFISRIMSNAKSHPATAFPLAYWQVYEMTFDSCQALDVTGIALATSVFLPGQLSTVLFCVRHRNTGMILFVGITSP